MTQSLSHLTPNKEHRISRLVLRIRVANLPALHVFLGDSNPPWSAVFFLKCRFCPFWRWLISPVPPSPSCELLPLTWKPLHCRAAAPLWASAWSSLGWVFLGGSVVCVTAERCSLWCIHRTGREPKQFRAIWPNLDKSPFYRSINNSCTQLRQLFLSELGMILPSFPCM